MCNTELREVLHVCEKSFQYNYIKYNTRVRGGYYNYLNK